MLKDNFYLMEKKMREEIHKDYWQQLIEKENQLKKYREAFHAYKNELSADIKGSIDRDIETIDPKLKAKANFYKSLGHNKNDMAAVGAKAVSSHILAGAIKGIPKYKNPDNEKYINPWAVWGGIAEDPHEESEPDNYDDEHVPTLWEEVAQLHRALWNQRNFMRLKEIVLKEKHERDIFNLKQQLTSN